VVIFKPILVGTDLRERSLCCLGAFLAIVLTSAGWCLVFHDASPLVIAPIGASAVIVFAIPASPLAQPWPVIGGNTISACVGLVIAWLVPDPTFGPALAVSVALAVMSLTRTLHPPGGAVALTAALGGASVAKWGVLFPLVPVGVNSVALVLAGILFHRLSGRSYPHRPVSAPKTETYLDGSFIAADLDQALVQMGETFDIARSDLELLLHQAELNARKRRQSSMVT
jgi:CBS domain-containing membrane protein